MFVRSALLAALLSAPAAADRPLGLNLAGVRDWSTELVFVDAFKTARPWISQAQGKGWGQGGPLALDAKGWVRSLAPGQFAETLLFVDQRGRYPGGDYVCLYDGKGDLQFGSAARLKEQTPGRAVVTVDPAKGQVSIKLTKTDPADPVRNIRFVLPGFEEKYRTEPFHPSLLRRLQGFTTLRFMDWGDTNNSTVRSWVDRATPDNFSQATDRGVALEYQIALANAADADPWFCAPHLADDGYVREMARLIKATLKPGRRAYVEYSNETWNGQFAQARYCRDQGLRLGLSKNPFEAQLRYSSQRSVEIFKLFEQEYGGTGRLVRVIAAQSANPWTGTTELDWKDASKFADAVAIAPYFGNSLGDPKRAAATAAMTPEKVIAECRKQIEENRAKVREYAAVAKKRGLKLMAYEAGQHLAGHGGAENNVKLMELFHAVNRHSGMKDLYLADMRQWFDASGDVLCLFSSVGRYSKWGSWGLLEHGDQNELTAPKMAAVREFMKGN